jgi:hypothetical protein
LTLPNKVDTRSSSMDPSTAWQPPMKRKPASTVSQLILLCSVGSGGLGSRKLPASAARNSNAQTL